MRAGEGGVFSDRGRKRKMGWSGEQSTFLRIKRPRHQVFGDFTPWGTPARSPRLWKTDAGTEAGCERAWRRRGEGLGSGFGSIWSGDKDEP